VPLWSYANKGKQGEDRMTATQTAIKDRKVTIKFLSGIFKGMEVTEITNVNYTLGRVMTDLTRNRIVVIKIEDIEEAVVA
jgi:hypothetical protein